MGRIEYWNPGKYYFPIFLLDGEKIEKIWVNEEYIYVKSSLDRIWKSVQEKSNPFGNLYMMEITEEVQ